MPLNRWPARVALVLLLLTLAAAAPAAADNLPPMALVPFEELTSPAPPGSGQSTLAAQTAAGETIYLQWVETGVNRAVRVAAWQPTTGWGPVHTVAADPRIMANWADFPQILCFGDGQLASAWLRQGTGTSEAAEVFAATSPDGGATWGTPRRPHRDTKAAEHGFVSLMRNTSGTFDIAWLDGRKVTMSGPKKTPKGSMQLRLATWMPGDDFGPELLLDPRVCDCCQTGAARTLEGIFVAYRDRSDGEVRDISGVRFDRGRWLPPQNVYPDNWKISGCPVNGPAVATTGTNEMAVAWFSDRADSGQVKVAISSDGGVSFRRVVRVDGGDPLGRVAVEHLPDDSFAVAWLEKVGAAAELRVRRILPDGSLDGAVKVADTQINRESGFPRLGWSGVSLFITWTDMAQPGGQVRVGRYDWAKAVPAK
jgi:hypothetical protein